MTRRLHARLGERRPHASLDPASRHAKAVKIERLLALQPDRAYRLLEIGTGAGVIAAHFARHPELRCEVSAVDVHDQRLDTAGYVFQQVAGVELPFAPGSFDVVISNHVIEHVGDRQVQIRHLREIRRVLATDGQAYLAMPSRWMPVEPHYGLAFLSWLPRPWRSHYLRLRRRGSHYDCEPLALGELIALVRQAGLDHQHLGAQALALIAAEASNPGLVIRLAGRLPKALVHALRAWLPTHMLRLRPVQAGVKSVGAGASADPASAPRTMSGRP